MRINIYVYTYNDILGTANAVPNILCPILIHF